MCLHARLSVRSCTGRGGGGGGGGQVGTELVGVCVCVRERESAFLHMRLSERSRLCR